MNSHIYIVITTQIVIQTVTNTYTLFSSASTRTCSRTRVRIDIQIYQLFFRFKVAIIEPPVPLLYWHYLTACYPVHKVSDTGKPWTRRGNLPQGFPEILLKGLQFSGPPFLPCIEHIHCLLVVVFIVTCRKMLHLQFARGLLTERAMNLRLA